MGCICSSLTTQCCCWTASNERLRCKLTSSGCCWHPDNTVELTVQMAVYNEDCIALPSSYIPCTNTLTLKQLMTAATGVTTLDSQVIADTGTARVVGSHTRTLKEMKTALKTHLTPNPIPHF